MNASELTYDLHTHTNCSDGVRSPEALVEEAQWQGLTGIAVTDHDTTDGLAAACAAGEDRGIEVIAGVELSCVIDDAEVHILGYMMERPEEVEAACVAVRDHRHVRMREMVEKGQGMGMKITYEEVAELAGGGSVGRPHLARVLVERGYVRNVSEAFARYLGDKGAMVVPKKRLSVQEGIAAIRSAGGVPVLAHPGVSGVDAYLPDFVAEGLLGIEVHYSVHSREQEQYYLALAKKHGLVVTGGSDYHGDDNMGRRLGQPSVTGIEVAALRACQVKMVNTVDESA